MTFSPTRPDPARLARVPFGTDWLALEAPTGNAMSVRTRMAMYRLLVERGSDGCGAHDELNPFWGYASQLAWQERSGRLGLGASIEAGSWWGACNYALSVVPYVAAAQVGMVPAVAIEAREYDEVIPAWREALRALKDARDLDAIRLAIWRAHLASITLAVARHERELRALPPAEQRFARGWVRMVDLFAAAARRTDLDAIVESDGGSLPSRILATDDISDLPRPERGTVRRVGALADRPPWRWRVELAVWRRVMRTREAREDCDRLLAGMLGVGPEVWPARRRALAFALRAR
jgi:hypothetical protein